jgi:hypothetical protein
LRVELRFKGAIVEHWLEALLIPRELRRTPTALTLEMGMTAAQALISEGALHCGVRLAIGSGSWMPITICQRVHA